MIAILGSGFGIYGYLPALVGCGQCVLLPERYRAAFSARPELARFESEVRWARDERATLDSAEGVVLALRPADQEEWLPRCLGRPNLRYLLLEKPLARSPKIALALWSAVSSSARVVRVGYLFRLAPWAGQLRAVVAESGRTDPLSLRWNFLAHHFRSDRASWKRSTAAGGGAIRFYGIQAIAFLAELGYREVLGSLAGGPTNDEIETWTATFGGPGLLGCEVTVQTRSEPARFHFECRGRAFVDQPDPFVRPNESADDVLDRRLPVLTALVRSLWDEDETLAASYQNTLELWRRVEEATRFSMIKAPAALDHS